MNSLKLILFRMKKSVAYWIAFSLFGGLGIVFAVLAVTIYQGTIGIANLLILPFGISPFSSESIFAPSLSPFPFFLLSLGFSLVFVGEEFRTGTIKSQAFSGKSRDQIFLSMWLAGFVTSLSLVLVFQIFAVIFAIVLKVPFYVSTGFVIGAGSSSAIPLEASQRIGVFFQSFIVMLLAYVACYSFCFAITAILHNGWIGFVFGGIIFFLLFIVGMLFFNLSNESFRSVEMRPPFVLAELWLPHFWIRSFYAFQQNCLYEITKDKQIVTHADYTGYLWLASLGETLLLAAISIGGGILRFRKVDLR